MKKVFKFLFKVVFGFALFGLLASVVLYMIYHQPLPEGQSGPEADALAQKMLTAVNHEAYEQTRYLEWSFAKGKHRYKWDKQKSEATIEWDDYRTILNITYPEKSTVFKEGVEVFGTSKENIIKMAIEMFNNDSFWLVAPFKVFDPKTVRKLVTLENGSKGLLVTYTSGGTTPGDSYLWELGPTGFPVSYRMWVKIIPIGGVKATWDDWQVTESGAFLPSTHKLGPIQLDMGDVRAYN